MSDGGDGLEVLQLLSHTKINAGGSIQAWLLSRELVRLGHRVTFAVSERHGEPDERTRADVEAIGCRYVGLPLRRLAALKAIRDLLRERPFDVVHLHREIALQQFLRAAPFAPSVAAVANVGTSKPPSRLQARRLNARRIDRVVVVAEALKALLVRTAGVDPARVDVVFGAFDEERFTPDATPLDREAEFGVPAAARLVGMVANFDPKKGHRHFFAAARRVLAERDDCWFLCVGKGEEAALRAKAERAGLHPHRLVVRGFRDDVPNLLRTLDVTVCASTKGEGLTGALRESLAVGVPVISTAVSGNVELVRHGETGLLVPPADDVALARAILDVLSDPAAAAERTRRGQEWVRSCMTSRRRATRMAELYRDVAKWRRVREMEVEEILFPIVGGSDAAADGEGGRSEEAG